MNKLISFSKPTAIFKIDYMYMKSISTYIYLRNHKLELTQNLIHDHWLNFCYFFITCSSLYFFVSAISIKIHFVYNYFIKITYW